MTRVLLADDHPMIQSAVASLFEGTSYEIVAMVRSGSEALERIKTSKPDLVVLDIHMPDLSGIEVLRRLRRTADARRVIFLTAAIEDSALIEVLALGVNGIVLKDTDPGRLLDCMDAVCNNRIWIDPELAERATMLRRDGSGAKRLTPRERELIELVRKGLKNREIADELGVTEGTVKVYLHGLYERLGVANRTELAMKAR